MIELRAVPGPTGRLLKQMLTERGVNLRTGRIEAIISYGATISSASVPVLNANAGRLNKYAQLERLREARVSVPPFSRNGDGLSFPMLGRKFHHVGGKDIIPILGRDQEWPIRQRQSDFFTQYIPRAAEYRVWAFRGNSKGVYTKVLRHPEQLSRRVGANYDNGFAFDIVPESGNELRSLGGAAISALGLDFGAVDILQGPDRSLYVLEVNTAPGVEGPRQGISGIADSIARWVRNGFPRRNGDEAR